LVYLYSYTTYVDFSKAFDVVSHAKLFLRQHSYGIRDSVLLWLKSFFCGREMCTKVGLELSDVAELVSGIVRGSGLGPTMFLAYINELATILRKHGISVHLFADDVKLYLKFCMLLTLISCKVHRMT